MKSKGAAKWFFASFAVTVYLMAPGYRYWVIGSWFAYKVLHNKGAGQRFRVVPKGSQEYKRVVGG